MVTVNRDSLDSFVDSLAAEEYGIDAFLIYRDGSIVAKGFREPFREEFPHALFSVTKSFTSVAIGLLLDEGKISLEDKVVSFFPEYLEYGASENMSKITIYNLLTMTAGFEEAPDDFERHMFGEFMTDFPYSYRKRYKIEDISWVRNFLHSYVEHEPGDRFLYSDACSYMLSAIVQKVTGENLKSFLQKRVLSKLGIADFEWQISPEHINTGGWGIKLSMGDLLKFAAFLLNKGKVNGEQILSENYISQMGKAQVPTGASSRSVEKGFGFQTWIIGEKGDYAGIGAFGQMYIIYPRENLIYLQFGSSMKYMKNLALLENQLPEIFKDGEETAECAVYSLKPDTDRNVYIDERVVKEGRYIFSHNIYGIEAVAFYFRNDRLFLDIIVDGDKTQTEVGQGMYRYCNLNVKEDEYSDIHTQLLFRKAAIKGYTREKRLILKLDFYETGYCVNMEIEFMTHGIRCGMRRNFGFIPDADTVIIGARDE